MFFQVHFAPFMSNYFLVLQLQFSMNIHGVSFQFVHFLPFPFLYKDFTSMSAGTAKCGYWYC